MDDLLEIDRELVRACWAIRVLATHHFDGKESYGVRFELKTSAECGVDICMDRDAVNASFAQRKRQSGVR